MTGTFLCTAGVIWFLASAALVWSTHDPHLYSVRELIESAVYIMIIIAVPVVFTAVAAVIMLRPGLDG